MGLGVTVGANTYPSFALVGNDEWPRFHHHHSNSISWAVGIAWVGQAAGILGWFVRGGHRMAWWITAILAFAAVAMTAAVAVGLHNQLSVGRNASLLKRLQVVHWLRTVAWIGSALAATSALL